MNSHHSIWLYTSIQFKILSQYVKIITTIIHIFVIVFIYPPERIVFIA
ncbi:hypothetical protein HYW58_01750 [Candidatus Kaiserbacteria bacterium]|nr:hypothetical protein [Candidatus Kaiserbacteria bacterium]